MQRQCILMRELEYSITQGEPKVHHLVWILHATALLKAVILLSLLTYLTRSHALYVLILHSPIEYWIQDTLPNHYYINS